MIILELCAIGICGGLLIAVLRLDHAIVDAQERLRVLSGGFADAEKLAVSRQTFRRRQRAVETAVATGTQGLESVHQTLAQRWGGPASGNTRVYAGIRSLNRGVGRALSGLLAPRPRQHSESLEAWRAHQDDDVRPDAHEKARAGSSRGRDGR